MTEPDDAPTQSVKRPETQERPSTAPQAEDKVRQGRRFSVAPMRGRARGRVRYIEGTQPPGGCRFLDS